MLSKWKLWDFFKANPTSVSPERKGIYAVRSFDPIITQLFRDQIPQSYLGDEKIKPIMGKEATRDWVGDNLKTLGLFGNTESFFVHFAEEISSDAQEILLADDLLLEDRYLILSFSGNSDFFSELCAKEHVKGIEIQAPMFWENREFLEFFSSYTGVFLDYRASQLLQASVEATCSNYLNILEQLKINFDSSSITVEMLEEVLSREKLDQFVLAELFGLKKFTAFYKGLLAVETDYKSLMRFFGFMQKHMGKISDPSYLDEKKKLSKYDRQILSCSKLWSQSQVLRSISYFKELEIEAKLGRPLLEQKLRRDYLRSF